MDIEREWDEDVPLVKKMMGADYEKYFDEAYEENQRQAKYAWDALHPL